LTASAACERLFRKAPRLRFDLVIQGSAWFAERGSLTLDVPYRVAP
jgi:hypothetical protein